jgi:hypothetical protein
VEVEEKNVKTAGKENNVKTENMMEAEDNRKDVGGYIIKIII